MKGRDCLLLFCCLSAVWISLPSSSNLSVVQKWKIPFDSSSFRNSHFPEEWEKLPLPIITDINEDGKNDIIYVSTEYEISIASSNDIYLLGEEIADSSMVAFSRMKLFSTSSDSHLKLRVPDLTATFSSSILPEFGITYGRKPVAIAAGFIDPPHITERRKVIVVLTEGWVVMCFDHELNLLWESHAVQNPNPSLFHKEASILIDSTPLSNGDRGIIIVGGRKDFIDTASEKVGHEHYDKEEFKASKESLQKMREEALATKERTRVKNRKLLDIDDEEEDDASGEKVEEEENAHEEENHFSYYAFEGHSGTLRWKHEPDNFEDLGSLQANLEQAVDLFMHDSEPDNTDMALRLHLFHNLRHLGEMDWSFFYDDFKQQLPFVWRTREDTSITSDYFERDRNFGNPENSDDDNEEEYRTYLKRNVLVSRNTHGIEALHLYTGRTLARLELQAESLYLDVNNDHVIDRIEAIPNRPQRNKKKKSKKDKDRCLAVASSGVPKIEKLFEQNVCSSSGFTLASIGLDRIRGTNQKDEVDMANPTFSYAGNGRYNTIFLVSSGKVTSLSPEGELLWQTSTDCTWGKADTKKRQSRTTRFGKVESFLEMGGFPSIQPYSIYGDASFVAAVGYHTISILSASTGSLEAETRLPSVVNGPIIVGDWDSDQDNDIIVPCINGFIGLRITKGSGTPLYSMLFGVIILSLPLLYFSSHAGGKRKKGKAAFDESIGLQ